MIGDPVALTMRRSITRPAAALVEAFAGAQTSFIADAMNGMGALDYRIKPIAPDNGFVGTAVTASGGPRDNLAAMAAIDTVEPGDVIVIATGADESGAVVGDHWAMVARQKGAVAVITDGLLRDAPGIVASGLKAYARGVAPNAGYPHGPGEVNLPVSLGGITILPGDILVGDGDGVVVVPAAQAEAVAASLAKVKKAEAEMEVLIAAGDRKTMWNPGKYDDRGGVRYLD